MRVTLVAAQSLDGFITKHDEAGTAFTSAADKLHFRRVLALFDCSILGGTTYRVARDQIRARLTPSRRRLVLTRDPVRHAAEAVPGALEFTNEAPGVLLDRLAAAGHRECALLGGSQLHALFLAGGHVDRLWVTIEPRLFGQGTPFLSSRLDVTLQLEDWERLPESDSLLVRYQVAGRSPLR